jgi:uncharacterized protein YndB with AHSA1/START domain
MTDPTPPRTPDRSRPDRGRTDRVIDVSVEVPGTPEEVWRAIATGPGITSWFVPHEVDEREGGAVRIDFGGGYTESSTVAAWEPPRRLVLTGEGERALAFEWLVEARDGGTCVVRLVNTGFGPGEDWDADYHGMSEGWPLFLENLRLHLTHFRGQAARAVIPTAMVPGPLDDAFERVCAALGVPADLRPGDRLEASAPGSPPLAGRVASTAATPGARAYFLVLDVPAPGTAFLAVEGAGDHAAVSLWLYLYGADADGPADAWGRFLAELGQQVAPTA